MNDFDQAKPASLGNQSGAAVAQQSAEYIQGILKEVSDAISPVWPLQDYVAVNPYFGLRQRRFKDARAYLKVFSDCEMLMPVGYYARQYQRSCFDESDIHDAIKEQIEIGVNTNLDVAGITAQLQSEPSPPTPCDQLAPDPNPHRRVRTIAEVATQLVGVDWTTAVCDEISKFCACHYDQGQAGWQSPWRELPLYQAWRAMAVHDRNLDGLGTVGFREYVRQLPVTAEAAITFSLNRLGIPRPLWSSFLLCEAFSMPGWCAWAKYQDSRNQQAEGDDFVGLLALRLAYEVVLSETYDIHVAWGKYVHNHAACFPMPSSDNDSVLRIILLRASEIGYRKRLLKSVSGQCELVQRPSAKAAQMVFCIDVRSERMRRKIETVSDAVETFGFAGFFGMPIAFSPLGEPEPVAQLPVLLHPQFEVKQGLQHCGEYSDPATADDREQRILAERADLRSWRQLWRGFQTSAVGCFSFVETTGLFYAYKLLQRVLGRQSSARLRPKAAEPQCSLGPTLSGLVQQGITLERQADLAEGMLTNLGLLKNFSRLVVFCGHSSQTENNPLAAGLNCGACGGHSGEPNARFAALVLNQPAVRSALAARGIEIPAETHFLGALHNTTTDTIEFFELQQLPPSHQADLQQLRNVLTAATLHTREERMPLLASDTQAELSSRALDWSEVRPEWGLAGNAAFIVAPRRLTQGVDLDSRAFLHSYDHALDPTGKVLEAIMTAPMVVANWINMQYYASTVDNLHFGSGSKTVHNVVGQFGILSGNGGDLQTGLPWQSLHTGEDYQHLPLRLQVVIAAPRLAISRVLDKHDLIADLATNGWLYLIAIEPGSGNYRYTAQGLWEAI